LGGVIELFVDDTLEAKLIEDIIDSDVYSYRCDISQDFHVSKTDFILFKMHQLNTVDIGLKQRLIRRFEELDIFKTESLKIGFEIPRKDQVDALHEKLRDKIKKKLDKEHRSELAIAGHNFHEMETVKVLMRLWEITQEKLADDVAAHGNIKQEPKNNKLRLEEMSRKCVKKIQGNLPAYEAFIKERAKAFEKKKNQIKNPFFPHYESRLEERVSILVLNGY